MLTKVGNAGSRTETIRDDLEAPWSVARRSRAAYSSFGSEIVIGILGISVNPVRFVGLVDCKSGFCVLQGVLLSV